ncbi:TPA: hypothetical protein N0F65_006492 [Lagenidium giganteum]|uniref:subtilisin n=1 Tax=Lagenidium giganteum TaxID=4803 RepID=A0AAV2YRR8_9STRA|nr:TPA: hypothetical protein N0F65_006492 [Lagenidium giganteum]
MCWRLVLVLVSLVRFAHATHVWLVHINSLVSIETALSRISAVDEQDLRTHVHAALVDRVKEGQRPVIEYLRAMAVDGMTITPLWISNSIVVRVSELTPTVASAVEVIRWLPGVATVEEDAIVMRLIGFQDQMEYDEEEKVGTRSSDAQPQGNVADLHAPQLWRAGVTGQGVVVASIDSGVRYSHDALRDNFRGTTRHPDGTATYAFDYAFWAVPGTTPSQITPDSADEVGHGTHTMGTAVGSRGIGVAPNATWITARAFDLNGAAKKSDFLLAAQWVLCPTKFDGHDRNCSLGANVITNSFGVDRSTPEFANWKWLDDVLRTWKAAGVHSVFASGNTNGFQCGSVYFPGSSDLTLAVGALIGTKTLWGASGKGPSFVDSTTGDSRQRAIIKPDFVAPGAAIRSALSVKDDSYTRLTGTSMATPHVAGAIALLLSAQRSRPGLSDQPDALLEALKTSAYQKMSKPFLVPSTCGNTSYAKYPNNIYGWGLPNVCLAATKLGVTCQERQQYWSSDDAMTGVLEVA